MKNTPNKMLDVLIQNMYQVGILYNAVL